MIDNEIKDTFFAPAGRVSALELKNQINDTINHPITKVLLEAVSGYLLILNNKRQILCANQALLDNLTNDFPEGFAGLRPGEIFNCLHVKQGLEGCGTSEHCRTCGAVISILLCQKNKIPVEDECRLTIEKNGQYMAADYKVKVSPLLICNHELTALVLQDISPFKRREVLEKVFIHDFFNMVGGIQGWSEQFDVNHPEMAAKQIYLLSSLLKEEIRFQSLLISAEKEELEVNFRPINIEEILENLKNIFTWQLIAKKKRLEVVTPSTENIIYTDPLLLLRVLMNMLKNAYEASEEGQTIQVVFDWLEGQPIFSIKNRGYIPENIKEHIFERSFSTKGEGRGIGTYSMKLFGENYLKGKVTFTSDSLNGTCFKILLPLLKNEERKISVQAPRYVVEKKGEHIPQKVLIIDDDEGNGQLEEVLLKKIGFDVTLCQDGMKAVELYTKDPSGYYFILTDFAMTPIDGIEVAKRILKINPTAIILMCSGFDDHHLNKLTKDLGVYSISQKPSIYAEMVNLLVSNGLVLPK